MFFLPFWRLKSREQNYKIIAEDPENICGRLTYPCNFAILHLKRAGFKRRAYEGRLIFWRNYYLLLERFERNGIMKITDMRVNHFTDPVGFDLRRPRVSWVTESNNDKRQAAARVVVAKDAGLKNVVYDTGKREDISSLCCELPIELSPRTRYYWRVMVWTESGALAVSDTAFFETGKLSEPWRANWIAAARKLDTMPRFRKEFTLTGKIKSARAYVCGLGLYELEINGSHAGDEFLTPGFHSYDFWLQYQTYDITSMLREGGNAVGVSLGDGWYKGRFGFGGGFTDIYGDRDMLICEIAVTFEDGSEKIIASDGSWLCGESPVKSANIYDGEIYDARRLCKGWSEPGFSGGDWTQAEEIKCPCGALTERRSPEVRITQRIAPVEIIHTPAGETVVDFGQNMAGWMEFCCKLPAGRRVRLKYGEVLQNGNFYNKNLRTAKAEFVYYSDGLESMVRPHFTYYGFRYVKVIGLGRNPDKDLFTACAVSSDTPRTGSIETSDALVNKLFSNVVWGQRGNFVDVPTDCPQRDERMGWTGDAQIFAATASFNMYTPAFYTKYMTDVMFEQSRRDGSVPFVVPMIKPPQYEGKPSPLNGSSCAWGDAATVIPWTLYRFYGDKALLNEQYPCMKGWVDFIKRQDDADGAQRLWLTGFHFADWLALDNPDPKSSFGGTDKYFVASAYYAYSAALTAKAAEVLGKKDDFEYYSHLTFQIKESIFKRYFTSSGKCRIKTQTALVLSLFMGLTPDNFRPGLAKELMAKLHANNMKLNTGFVGTPYLCRVLTDAGLNTAAYTLLLNKDYPGWLHEVLLGATTIWERWNSLTNDGKISSTGMNSLNHYAYGSIAEWMYRDVCGINPAADVPGFKKILFAPRPDKRLKYARAQYDSASGRIESGWRFAESGIDYDFTVPFDTEAKVVLATENGDAVTVDGKPAGCSGSVCAFLIDAGRHIVKVRRT